MKFRKAQIHARVYRLPELRFEDQRLTSFSGLVLLQALFRKVKLGDRLQGCLHHLSKGMVVGLPAVTMLLIVHLMLGFRRLRDLEYYREDPLVARVLGLRRLPHLSTVRPSLGPHGSPCSSQSTRTESYAGAGSHRAGGLASRHAGL